MDDSSPQVDPRKSLAVLRIMWAALLMGQIVFLIVVAVLIQGGPPALGPELHTPVFIIAGTMLVVLVPVGYIIRSQTYKKHWQAGVITPQGYFTGNLLLLAICEGVSIFALITVMLTHSWWPHLVPAALAMGAMAINFPHGRPMFSDDVAMGRDRQA